MLQKKKCILYLVKKRFLTTQEKVEKYVELTEKTPEAKIMMQSSFSDSCVLIL